MLAVTTTLMTNLVTNSAAASILTPVAIGIAADMGTSPRDPSRRRRHLHLVHVPQPVRHQSNLMVMRPGGYSTATFAKFGSAR